MRTFYSPPKNRRRFKRTLFSVMLAFLVFGSSQATSGQKTNETLTLSENTRLEASICPDAMNRIAVVHDRIAQVFGDEGTFVSQNDEATGQLFLKPTLQNGSKELSLTLITEHGVTQDLTLKPTAKSAQTIILNRDSNGPSSRPSLSEGNALETGSDMPLNHHNTLSFQTQVISFLKQAIVGQLPPAGDGAPQPFASPTGYAASFIQSWQAGPYRVHSYLVENTTEAPLDLHEPGFYHPGDLALSFDARSLEGRTLPPHGTVALYKVSCHQGETP